jgi:beta-lactamase class C
MKKRYLFPVSLLLILIGVVFHHSNKPAAQTRLLDNPAALLPKITEENRAFVQQYEEYLLKSIEAEGIPGAALAIVVDSSIALLKGYGVRDLDSQQAVDKHTVFRLASISKGITGLLAGKLEAEGKVNWNTPVFPFCYNLKLHSDEYAQSLQLQHILSHSTGLPRHTYSNLLNMGVPYMEILPRLSVVQPTHTPGTFHNYQNVAFSLSGEVLAGVGGASFSELLQKKIFTPLQMKDASTGLEGMEQHTNIALPHKRSSSGYATAELEQKYYEVGPAAGVNASIDDMSKLLMAMMGHQPAVFPDSILQEVLQPYVPIFLNDRSVSRWDFLESAHYGMGWRIFETPEMKIIQHSGFVNGFRTEIAFSPDQNIGLVLLTNAPNYTVGYSIPHFFEMYLKRKEKT